MSTETAVSYEEQANFLSKVLFEITEIANQLDPHEFVENKEEEECLPLRMETLQDIRDIARVLPRADLTLEQFDYLKGIPKRNLWKDAGYSED